ncbi:MAG: PolC-type DNA polymerase III N-terminal domain-containing protein, partial [Sedimentibacter sp.]
MKRIKEIFSDYEVEGNLNVALVEGVVLNKKNKTLEMKIKSDKYIEIRELEGLNDFIKKRFALDDSKIVVNYAEGTNKKPIQEEIKNIVLLLAEKSPALKAILSNSEYEIAENTINFNFKSAISGLLKAKGYDKKIHESIKKLYGEAYQINFVDKVGSEEFMKLQEDALAKEMQIIQNEINVAPRNDNPKIPKKAAEINKGKKAETVVKKSNPFLILGRNGNLKDTIIKITDITPDEGRIAIEGE